MRTVRYDRFGPPDVLHVVDSPDPAPAAGELLIKVVAASLNPLDWKIRAGHVRFVPLFARPPRTPGTDLAGEVIGVGGGPGPRHLGERVFGVLLPFGGAGSCAQYAVIGAHRVVPIPPAVSFEAAATLPVAGGTALQALTDEAELRSGQRVLITGAAGGVGHFAVQLAKHLGAHVTGTCGPANVEFVRSLGADEVLDYTLTDASTLPKTFDLVLDLAESLGWRHAGALLVRGGLFLGVGGSATTAVSGAIGAAIAPFVSGIRARALLLKGGATSCTRLGALAAAGVLKPHIARRVTLDEVADAQRQMETGHGRGKIVVTPHVSAE